MSCKNAEDHGASARDFDASSDKALCDGECALMLQSACTCGTDDPCGWQDDGFCDRGCLFKNTVGVMFDDGADCPGLCDGACEEGFYTACTCGTDDPCNWSKDASCDIACVRDNVVSAMFDDIADCAADAGV